jgi:hypothetical protein
VSCGVHSGNVAAALLHPHPPGDTARHGKPTECRFLRPLADDQEIPRRMRLGNQRVRFDKRMNTFLHSIEPADREQRETAI